MQHARRPELSGAGVTILGSISMQLFASIALMFWYILMLFLNRD
ncbi:MAG: hypothetical protein V3S15_01950 [Woeseiaceae bacterium]